MEPFAAFVMKHWELSSAFVVVLVILAVNEWRHRAFGFKQVSPQELVNMLNHDGAIPVDVRASAQFKQGHIIDALNVPIADFNQKLTTLEKYKSKPVVIVCASGLDVTKAGKLLETAGFSQVFGLAGGMQAWKTQELPTIQSK